MWTTSHLLALRKLIQVLTIKLIGFIGTKVIGYEITHFIGFIGRKGLLKWGPVSLRTCPLTLASPMAPFGGWQLPGFDFHPYRNRWNIEPAYKILLLFLGIALHVVRLWNGVQSTTERVQLGRLTIQTSFCPVETDWTKPYWNPCSHFSLTSLQCFWPLSYITSGTGRTK